jgi:pimeloyl-ACP methyl ester carboxylesterase
MGFAVRNVTRGSISLWTEILPFNGDLACLLIGGAGSISAFWPDEFCHSIARLGVTVIRYDHRDAGHSSFVDYNKSPYTLADLTADALAILNECGFEKVHVVGHSMGGFIAQMLAIEHPSRTCSLTNISSHTGSPDVPPPLESAWPILLSNQPKGVLDEDLPGYMKVWRFLNGDCSFDEQMARQYTEELYRRNPKTLPADHHVAAIAVAPDRTFALRRLNIPSIVIHGDHDPLVPSQGGQMTAEAIPNAKLTLVEGAGHMFFNKAVWRRIQTAILEHIVLHRRSKT